MKRVILLSLGSLIFVMASSMESSAQNQYQETMLVKLNKLRAKGCNCDGRFMAPVGELTWSGVLLTSAYRHAKDMRLNNYFSHYSQGGYDIGDRLDAVGYAWSYCGENLGMGQRDFDEVLEDWIKSKSHCMMLMNPKVTEVAIAKEGKYWVQHFGKKFNPKYVNTNRNQ